MGYPFKGKKKVGLTFFGWIRTLFQRLPPLRRWTSCFFNWHW